MMVNLLHSSATIIVNLLEVLITFKVSSWLLAQKKVALRQEAGKMLSSKTGPRLDYRSLRISWREVLPIAQPRLTKTIM